MKFKKDILLRLKNEFPQKVGEASEILHEATKDYDYLNHDRIIRCIIHCANKSIEGLHQSIEIAKSDPRDIMYSAEYIPGEKALKSKRIRDYSRPFDKSRIDMKG